MGYFAHLKDHDLGSMELDECNKLFVAEGLFQYTFVISLSEGLNQVYPSKDPPVPKPKKELLDSLHGYLLKQFEDAINSPYYAFFLEFNDEILGLDQESERSIAARYYRIFSDQIMTKVIRFFHTSLEKRGIEKVRSLPKMEMLLGQREALKSNLADSPILIPYLEGNKTYFEKLQGNSSVYLKSFLEFEIVFKILVNINALYGFEVHENTEVQGRIKEEVSDKPPNKELAVQKQTHSNNKIQKKKPSFTDRQAIEYLIRHVFSKSE